MFFLVATFQNCSVQQFKNSLGQVPLGNGLPLSNNSGNGGTYDGKIRILHHYVNGFTCEGKQQPESILVRRTPTDWYLIQNTQSLCGKTETLVTGVVYDDVTKVAQYNGKTYISPTPYFVSATENPMLPDLKLDDGVCEDANGKCSLLAAVQQAGTAVATNNVIVEIPAGTFALTAPLDLTHISRANTVTIHGVSSSQTFLDGQNSTAHFMISGYGLNTVFQNIAFYNGNRVGSQTAGSIALASFGNIYSGAVEIENCSFVNTKGSDTLYVPVTSGPFTIRSSQFSNSEFSSIRSAGNTLTVEDTVIADGQTNGISTDFAMSKITVRRSSIYNHMSYGAIISNCMGCLIENTTIYNNRQDGLSIFASTSTTDFTINNSTLFNNGLTTGSSIAVSFVFQSSRLVLNNSVVAVNNAAKTNCRLAPGGTYSTIVATNSAFDDSSCALESGTGNIYANTMLASFSLNGGSTPNFLPLTGSPLIDAGDNLTCAAMDQRKYARPHNGRCDIGATEL